MGNITYCFWKIIFLLSWVWDSRDQCFFYLLAHLFGHPDFIFDKVTIQFFHPRLTKRNKNNLAQKEYAETFHEEMIRYWVTEYNSAWVNFWKNALRILTVYENYIHNKGKKTFFAFIINSYLSKGTVILVWVFLLCLYFVVS